MRDKSLLLSFLFFFLVVVVVVSPPRIATWLSKGLMREGYCYNLQKKEKKKEKRRAEEQKRGMPINFYTHIKGRIPNGKELTKKKKREKSHLVHLLNNQLSL